MNYKLTKGEQQIHPEGNNSGSILLYVKYLTSVVLLLCAVNNTFGNIRNPNPKSFLNGIHTTTCGLVMQDSVVGYVKSATGTQIFYLLTIKNTGILRDSFHFTMDTRSTPLYPFIETVNGATLSTTPGLDFGASYTFIMRFEVPNGSPAETTNYTNLIATSSNCPGTSDSTCILTHLYSGKAVTGDSCDVGITKTSNVGTVTAGNVITYTISLINNLPGVANDVFVIDTLASSLVFISDSIISSPDTKYTINYNATSRTVQFKYLVSLGQSQPITFIIKAKAVCTAVPSVYNKVSVSSSTYDNNAKNDTASVAVGVTSAYASPTAAGITNCYNSTATVTATGAGSRIGYKWYTASSGGTLLYTGQSYTTPVLNASTSYYVGFYNIDTVVCAGPRTAVAVTVKAAPVISAPSATTVCPNNAASFGVHATGTSLTYQWQVSTDNGSSWTSLTNASPYSHVTDSTLMISSAPYSMNGYWYRCNVAAGGCSTISSSVAILTVRKSYTWLGVNTEWNDAVNWCSGIPDSSSDVTIPSGLTYYPIISTKGSTHNITISGGATVTLNSGTLRIFGSITNSGYIDAQTGTIEMKGSASQGIAGSIFYNKTILNLKISNTSSGGVTVSSTAADTLKISGTLSFGTDSSKLYTGNNIDLLSTSSRTANVGVVATNNLISGQVIVDRYINTGTVSGQHARTWQFLSTPTSGQTIRESWMENGSSAGGYGTQITGPGGTSAGFDLYSPGISIKYYNVNNNNWDPVSNANSGLYRPNGYMLFIRGDRTVTSAFAPAKNTILRSKGILTTGSTLPVTVSGDHFQSIGNPYPSIIDFTKVSKDAGVDDLFYTWDPYLSGSYGFGGYQTISGVNDWKPVPGGTTPYLSGVANPDIQSGQAFFVHATSGSSFVQQTFNVSFTETCKVDGSPAVNFSRTDGKLSGNGFLRASLYTSPDANAAIADGNVVVFGHYSNGIDGNDALKLSNGGENFSLKRDGKMLAIEARSPLSAGDTIFYNLNNLRQQTYQLRFAPENLQQANLEGELLDQYLGTSTKVSLIDSTFVNVTFNGNTASRAADRFKMVFSQMASLPVTFVSVTAVQKEQGIMVQWKVENESGIEQYETERSADGNSFEKQAQVTAFNSGIATYGWTDMNPSAGDNYYRIKSVSQDGKISYSAIVKVMGKSVPAISVYPNPVLNGILNLIFNNEPAGVYKIRLLNSLGQLIISANIHHAGGTYRETIPVNKLTKGIYQMEICKPDGIEQFIKVVY